MFRVFLIKKIIYWLKFCPETTATNNLIDKRAFRTLSNIYDVDFYKLVNGFYFLSTLGKKSRSRLFAKVITTLLSPNQEKQNKTNAKQ